MKRKAYQYLLQWKKSPNRVPLIIKGARQVGKTYLISEFAKNEYKNYVFINFELEKEIRDIFESTNLEPNKLIKAIEENKNIKIDPKDTLLIFDEIQACPIAITSLKYFNELANQYHIIASGSLLGVSINRNHVSFPVGKVMTYQLFPMDFEEFLIALDKESLLSEIKICFKQNKPINDTYHNLALKLFKEYLFVGGMPAVISEYLRTKNYESVREIQKSILDSYKDDMAKYNKEVDIKKTLMVFESIPTQLAKENKKFKYSLLQHGGRAKQFQQNLFWLSLTGIASQLFRLENIKLPLKAYESTSDFKLYINDIGLCIRMMNLTYNDVLSESWKNIEFKGGLIENYVFNQLLCNDIERYYWTSNNEAEVDFITRIGQDIVPIEVKSNLNVRSRSLSVYIKKYCPKYSIRISAKNFGFENNIKSIPLYAVFCLTNK